MERYCQLVFLTKKPSQKDVKYLMSLQGKEYKFFVRGRVFYYDFLREDAMKRRFINFEKILSVRGTARTWKVVNKLMALLK